MQRLTDPYYYYQGNVGKVDVGSIGLLGESSVAKVVDSLLTYELSSAHVRLLCGTFFSLPFCIFDDNVLL